MNSSIAHCAPSADDAFGPVVAAHCRQGFDFTITFEQSILVLLPAAFLLVAAPFRIVQLRKAPVKVAGRHLRLLKLAAITALAVSHLVLVVLWASRPASANFSRISIAAACVCFASSLMFCVLSYAEHVKSPRPSSLLNVFLLVSLVLDLALLRTLWLLPPETAHTSIAAAFTAAFALKATLFVLEAWDKSVYLVSGAGPYAPEVTAGLYAKAVFAWITPLLLTGFRRLLTPVDLFSLDEDMGAAGLNEKFWRHWRKAPPGCKHRVIRCCIATLRSSLIAVVVPRLALLAFTVCQPLVLNRFLVFLEDSSQTDNAGYGLVAAYGLVYFGIAVTQALYWYRNGRSFTMLRGVLVSAIFSKATEMSITSVNDSAAVTLMSSDVDIIVRAIREIHEFWANTIQIAIATWLLSIQIGYAASGPIIVSFVALIGTVAVAPLAKKYQVVWLGKTQERVGITSAMIGHIKSIKMTGLTQVLSETIAKLRIDEMDASRPFRVVGSITSSIAQIPLLLSPVVAFAMFQGVAAHSNHTLDATRMFSALSLIILLAQPLFWMFEVILDMSAALGAFERIENFLLKEPRRDYRQVSSGMTSEIFSGDESSMELQTFRNQAASINVENTSEGVAVFAKQSTFAWSDQCNVLHNINLTIGQGQFVLLLGAVASGKSTLLKGLLGEVPNTTGVIQLEGERVSWCDQSPWLENKSIRDNIIGHSHLDTLLYRIVVRSCDLDTDFEQLPEGDMTLVGSKGLAMSGGQKQRIALARAIYSRPHIALFDDILTGLDNLTAQRVFCNLFASNGLLKEWGTTVILATQSVDFLSLADRIISLEDGTISEQGTFEDLREAGGYVQSILKARVASELSSEETNIELDNGFRTTTARPRINPALSTGPDKRRQLGDRTVYRYYFRSIGRFFLGTLLLLEIGWTFLQSFPTVWLNFWADANAKDESQKTGYYLGIYALLQVIGVIWFAVLIWFVLVPIAAKSGVFLHHKLLWAVMSAPLSLFTTTDTGSITTRFSQDVGIIDNRLPLALVVTLASFFGVLAKGGLLTVSSYYVAIAFPFLFVLYYYLQRGYLRTSRQLRLLDLEEKAPLYTQFLETLSGLATLRAFGWVPETIESNHVLVDRSQRPFYLLTMVQRWLVLVLDMMAAALALLVVGFAFMLRGRTNVGLTGVSLVQLIGLSETLNMLIQFWTSIETSIGAVARIKQFSEETPDENKQRETQEPPSAWPTRGAIQIKELTASYDAAGNTKALDGISLDINAGEKVGICGRTASGKTSLLLSLLGLLDTSSGSIVVDNIPLASIARESIRKRFITITQDQFVLPGTVRQNIDPLGIHTTEAIVQALDLVKIWNTIEQNGGLDAPFKEDMLSHGQKQLFFLARSVLSKSVSRVVLMDEASSSVDQKTEETVKKIIESQFKEHTVISIAHRLDTIIDYDRVAVMENGRIVEIGKPKELMSSPSKFRALLNARARAGN